MKYRELKTILNMYDHSRYEKEYELRFNSYSTLKFPLYINGLQEQLFCVLTNETIVKIEKIYNNISSIKLIKQDKGHGERNIFFKNYINELFVDELNSTNEIEGVATSRHEIQEAKDDNLNDKKRFHFLVTKYNQLLDNQEINLNNAKDIRKIYDELLNTEIIKKDRPDGRIFRKGEVSVTKRDKSHDVVHSGVYPEESIIIYMNNLLNFINSNTNDEMSIFVKIAVAHYYFGYIHPFYDGNGRINRFISTYLLKKNISELLAFKLSKTIKDNVKKYDEAFNSANQPLNRGDVTIFVNMFIDVLYQASTEIKRKLKEIEGYLSTCFNVVEKMNISENAKKLLLIIVQEFLTDCMVTQQELIVNGYFSAHAIRKTTKELVDNDLVEYQIKKGFLLKDKFKKAVDETINNN